MKSIVVHCLHLTYVPGTAPDPPVYFFWLISDQIPINRRPRRVPLISLATYITYDHVQGSCQTFRPEFAPRQASYSTSQAYFKGSYCSPRYRGHLDREFRQSSSSPGCFSRSCSISK